MIKIGKSYIKTEDKKAYLCSDIVENDNRYTLWFQTDIEYQRYLCTEREDAFIVLVLAHAMETGQNISFEGVASEKLLYQLENQFLPCMNDFIAQYHWVDISGDYSGQCLENAGAVGTGFSGGVDSFYTVLKHLETLKDYKLTYLTFFEMGSTGDKGGTAAARLAEGKMRQLQKPVDTLGLPYLILKSNIQDMYDEIYVQVNSWRLIAGALALQKLFKVYYLASGYTADEFYFTQKDPAHYGVFNCRCFETENLTFYENGVNVKRIEKTRYIADFKVVQKNLNVCCYTIGNCGKCPKCQRTLLALELINRIDMFADCFDLKHYYNRREKIWGYALAHKEDPFFMEIICYAKMNRIKVWNLKCFIYYIFYLLRKRAGKLPVISKLKEKYFKPDYIGSQFK